MQLHPCFANSLRLAQVSFLVSNLLKSLAVENVAWALPFCFDVSLALRQASYLAWVAFLFLEALAGCG